MLPSHELPATPSPFKAPSNLRTPSAKRKSSSKENASFDSETQSSKKRRYTTRRTDAEKLEQIFQILNEVNWTLSELLYHLFCMKDALGKEIHRTHQHSKYVSRFLQGDSKYTPGTILELWLHSSDGRGNYDGNLMYSISMPYTSIKHVCAALTSFSVQIVGARLVKEACKAVDVNSGLHATRKRHTTHRVEWADVGAATVERVAEIIKLHQPLTWYYTNIIAGGDKDRGRRPIEMVCSIFSQKSRF